MVQESNCNYDGSYVAEKQFCDICSSYNGGKTEGLQKSDCVTIVITFIQIYLPCSSSSALVKTNGTIAILQQISRILTL